jgi:hypothetical protein
MPLTELGVRLAERDAVLPALNVDRLAPGLVRVNGSTANLASYSIITLGVTSVIFAGIRTGRVQAHASCSSGKGGLSFL